MNLNEILKTCVGRKISTFKIAQDKIFPLDDHNMILKSFGVDGYYNIVENDKVLYTISVVDGDNFNVKDYTIRYDRNDNIQYISIGNVRYEIFFK